MPRLKTLEPVFDKSRSRWKVTIPGSMTVSGNRMRSWHATREAAREYVAELTNSDRSAAIISPLLAGEADKARGLLEPWGLDILQAVREHCLALEVLNGSGSILEAARAWRAAQDARASSKPFGEAIDQYLDSKGGLRPATLAGYRHTLEGVFAPLHHKLLADITTTDFQSALKNKPAASKANNRRNLLAFWTWACKAPRTWANISVAIDIEAPSATNDADIVILKPLEVRALLTAAEAHSPAAAAAYAVAIFAGVRMAELGKLLWGDIGEDSIEIGKAISKKHSRRLIPIGATLRAWLDAGRGDASDIDDLCPSNWIETSKAIRRAAGWNVVARILDNPPKPTRGPWPANASRHTCASIQVAIGTPLEMLTFAFGHGGGHDMLRKHYVSRMTKKQALEILSIGPKNSKIAQLQAVG